MPSRLSRRAALHGVGGVSALAALSACGGAPALDLSRSAATGSARRHATLRIARPAASAAETLDPASALSAYEYLGALYNRVVRLDREGRPVPDLAQEWSSNADATEWVFRLRDGVRFHDGRRLTARDVRYTIGHVLDPDTASPQAGPLSTLIKASGVDAVDTTTVRFRLTSPNAEFPSLLAAYQCYVIPEDSAATIGRTGIGTGPYTLESFTAAGPGSVQANDAYFAGRAATDRIEFFSIQDTSARVNALLARQVDLLSQTNIDDATARVVAGSHGTTVARDRNAQWYTIPMLATSPEFSDVRVRQAMKLAYDPQAVLSTALQGNGTAGWDNPVIPGSVGRLTTRREHDPDKARALLKRAGKEGLSTRIYTSSYDPNFTPIAIAYADQVKAAGIDLRITNAASDSYYTAVWFKKPLMVSYWFAGRPIDQLLNQIFRSGSSYNEGAWSNKRFDNLLDQARADTNERSRRAKYEDAQQLIVDDGSDMTPVFGDRLVGMSDQVVNYDEFGFEFDYLAIGLRS